LKLQGVLICLCTPAMAPPPSVKLTGPQAGLVLPQCRHVPAGLGLSAWVSHPCPHQLCLQIAPMVVHKHPHLLHISIRSEHADFHVMYNPGQTPEGNRRLTQCRIICRRRRRAGPQRPTTCGHCRHRQAAILPLPAQPSAVQHTPLGGPRSTSSKIAAASLSLCTHMHKPCGDRNSC
jgi:hypothetical protein